MAEQVRGALVIELPQQRNPEPDEQDEPAWSLPPGAKTVDCFAFGEMDRTLNDLVSRVEILERRLSLAMDTLLDKETNR